ncbi:MAG: hypothetical protein JO187_12580 [Acidobacteria bacterium]|nr:hypothetical protein [Acidobacteriota bacterium]
MISRRTTVFTVIALGALLAAFSGFNWLYEIARAERHPVAHEITGNQVSWDPQFIWQGPTALQKISVMISLLAAIVALWSLWRDAKRQKPRRPTVQEQPGWSSADDEALRQYLNEQMKHHRKAS